MYPNIKNKRHSDGFTLTEILVSLLVLSIGMLGMAGIQMSGLKNSATSTYRTDATQFAYDLADAIRANSVAVDANVFHDIDIDDDETVTDPGHSCMQTTTSASVSSCSAGEMAAVDLYHWVTKVKNRLPGASLSISCNDVDNSDADDCTVHSTHTITLSWNENVDGDVNSNSFSYTFRP
ncbi:MAG: type IV pilus modification protein PilV [Gammaproteobacteria bacterium]|nr:type IV pilus modification protein PilV [Gammaproteobacteria bacterium]